jgi:hypothetical protein
MHEPMHPTSGGNGRAYNASQGAVKAEPMALQETYNHIPHLLVTNEIVRLASVGGWVCEDRCN